MQKTVCWNLLLLKKKGKIWCAKKMFKKNTFVLTHYADEQIFCVALLILVSADHLQFQPTFRIAKRQILYPWNHYRNSLIHAVAIEMRKCHSTRSRMSDNYYNAGGDIVWSDYADVFIVCTNGGHFALADVEDSNGTDLE